MDTHLSGRRERSRSDPASLWSGIELEITEISSVYPLTECGLELHSLDLLDSSRIFVRGNFDGGFEKGR